MPLQSIFLKPGVNTQLTPVANTAGIQTSQLLRFKQGLPQKVGGWSLWYNSPVSSTPVRDIHAFQSLRNQAKYVAAGSLSNLVVVSTAGVINNITPQYLATNPTPNLSVSSGSELVTIVDTGSSGAITSYGGVRFDTPVSLGGVLLSGSYLTTAVTSGSYTITSTAPATSTVASSGILPTIQVTAGSAFATIVLPDNNFQSAPGLYYPFRAPTTIGGITIQGPYQVTSIIDATSFEIGLPQAATTSCGPLAMNGGDASFYYFVTIGPQPTAGAYGAGNYGAGLYGSGTAAPEGTGTPITATDWRLDNWGDILVATPANGPIYIWGADLGYNNAQAIVGLNAPLFNIGAFVAQPQQQIMAYGSTLATGQQNPLVIRWCDVGNYNQWMVSATTAAGSFVIPTGSTLVGGVQAPLYGVFWTDIDCWIAQYIGQPLIYSFQRVGTGCGLLGQHAADVQSGNVFWAGKSNFYMLGPNGVQVLPCTVWDWFFQQLDTTNAWKVTCASNSVFNEVSWFFPIIGGTGENTAYVKLHVGEGNEYEWDYGYLSRTAWVDVTAVGAPIGADQYGNLMQHETSNDAAGVPITSSFETGYFLIGEGDELVFVDWCLPDAKFEMTGATTSASLQLTLYTTDYPGAPERSYGPFTITSTTTYINCRMRGRYWRLAVQSQDLGTWWRIGKPRFRWAPSGRR